jgi:hypothetical protein
MDKLVIRDLQRRHIKKTIDRVHRDLRAHWLNYRNVPRDFNYVHRHRIMPYGVRTINYHSIIEEDQTVATAPPTNWPIVRSGTLIFLDPEKVWVEGTIEFRLKAPDVLSIAATYATGKWSGQVNINQITNYFSGVLDPPPGTSYRPVHISGHFTRAADDAAFLSIGIWKENAIDYRYSVLAED